ncbi:cytokine-dependent hematopoietic cell linker [Mixophyes fleayi]|uniref:cytokine-dependent hematopoietic cell linker n=1 Tax=Mixophyes fleayi TaxID=3061075 RepID=UPI003F4DC360
MNQEEDIEPDYEAVSPEGNLRFKIMHHSKSNETSVYADKRYFQADTDNQHFNAPHLLTAVSHTHSSRVVTSTRAHRSHCKDSQSVTDQRSLNNTKMRDMIPPRLPTHIKSENRGRNACKSKRNAWISGSQSVEGPEVNRSLKPEKLVLQVLGGVSNTRDSCNERSKHEIKRKNETSLTFQPQTFAPKLCEEENGSARSRGSRSQKPCTDQSKDGSLIQYYQTRTCSDTTHHGESETKQVTSTSTQRPCRNTRGRNDINRTQQPQYNASSPNVVETKLTQCSSFQSSVDCESEVNLGQQLQQEGKVTKLQSEKCRIAEAMRPPKSQRAPRRPSDWTNTSSVRTRHEERQRHIPQAAALKNSPAAFAGLNCTTETSYKKQEELVTSETEGNFVFHTGTVYRSPEQEEELDKVLMKDFAKISMKEEEEAAKLQSEICRMAVSMRPPKSQRAPRRPPDWTNISSVRTRHEERQRHTPPAAALQNSPAAFAGLNCTTETSYKEQEELATSETDENIVFRTGMVYRPEEELSRVLLEGITKRAMKEKVLRTTNWYLKKYNRYNAESLLYEENKDGVFLVRDNSHCSFNEPYVLSVYYENKVYHIKIRYLEDSQQYALGTGLRGNHKFNSVKEMIEFHRNFPLLLVDGKSRRHFQGQQCFLTRPPILTNHRSSLSL